MPPAEVQNEFVTSRKRRRMQIVEHPVFTFWLSVTNESDILI
jgi:hypothetical protein